MSRNAAIVWFNPDLLIETFSAWNRHSGGVLLPQLTDCIDADGNRVVIPPDAKITDCTYDWGRQQFGLRVEHPTMPAWADGSQCSSLLLTMQTLHFRETDPADPSCILVPAAQ